MASKLIYKQAPVEIESLINGFPFFSIPLKPKINELHSEDGQRLPIETIA